MKYKRTRVYLLIEISFHIINYCGLYIMSAEEEQLEEIEALESIFPDCFTLVSNTSPMEYKIRILPNSEGDDDNHVIASLVCKIPAEYPNESIPELSIEPEKGLNKAQVDELTNLAVSTATENMGSPSIFIVAEVVKDWLLSNNVAGQDGSMYAQMMLRMQNKEIEEQKKISVKEDASKLSYSLPGGAYDDDLAIDKEEQERLRKRQAGTMVNPEAFIAWKKKFDDEMRAKVASAGLTPAAAAAVGMYVPVNATLSVPAGTDAAAMKTVFNFTQDLPGGATTSSSASGSSDAAASVPLSGKQLFLLKKGVEYTGTEEEGEEAAEAAAVADNEEEDEDDEDYDPEEGSEGED